MLHAQHLGAKVAGNGGQISQGGQWSAGDLKRNLRGGRDGAANCYQHTASGDVEGGGKLE